jgi:RNA polymerase sigma-70 factor (ECF subfamily)
MNRITKTSKKDKRDSTKAVFSARVRKFNSPRLISQNMEKSIEEQFLQVYEKHSDAIFRYCYFRLYNREKAKDIAQDAFMKAWVYLQEGNTIDNLRAFIYRVANNLIIDYVRKKKESSLEMLEESGFNPSVDGKQKEEQRIDGLFVQETLNLLEEEYRDVVYMRYIEELAPREIAQILDESVNVISVRIHRGLKKLKILIGEKK